MNGFLDELAARRRFGIKPGLETIRAVCAQLGNPQLRFPSIHVAGTNGKGAVVAILDSCLRAAGLKVGRYTSPHLVSLNERFYLDGAPVADAGLERLAAEVRRIVAGSDDPAIAEMTFFEALTAVAFQLYAEAEVDYAVLETGLGGRLDATNVCRTAIAVITRIGLDHCDWLGDTVERIAAEKAGIINPGVPVVLGENLPSVVAVVRRQAEAIGAPFVYAPELVRDSEIPAGFALEGTFNRENAVTALAVLKTLGGLRPELPLANPAVLERGFSAVVWPGRFQRLGAVLVDGAHNPPAASALARALAAAGVAPKSLTLVAGFCGDKDVDEVLRLLAPFVARAYAVRTNNPRSLEPEALVARMAAVGIPAEARPNLAAVPLPAKGCGGESASGTTAPTHLIAGSLFLAGEALVQLGATAATRFDPAEAMKGQT